MGNFLPWAYLPAGSSQKIMGFYGLGLEDRVTFTPKWKAKRKVPEHVVCSIGAQKSPGERMDWLVASGVGERSSATSCVTGPDSQYWAACPEILLGSLSHLLCPNLCWFLRKKMEPRDYLNFLNSSHEEPCPRLVPHSHTTYPSVNIKGTK